MTDILIRNVPDEDVQALDERAREAGLSRADFIRTRLHVEARRTWTTVLPEDFERLAEIGKGLDDDALMAQAWS